MLLKFNYSQLSIIYVFTSAVKFQISNIKSQIFFFRFGSNLKFSGIWKDLMVSNLYFKFSFGSGIMSSNCSGNDRLT